MWMTGPFSHRTLCFNHDMTGANEDGQKQPTKPRGSVNQTHLCAHEGAHHFLASTRMLHHAVHIACERGERCWEYEKAPLVRRRPPFCMSFPWTGFAETGPLIGVCHVGICVYLQMCFYSNGYGCDADYVYVHVHVYVLTMAMVLSSGYFCGCGYCGDYVHVYGCGQSTLW